jgi:hypothetical protein
MAWHWGSSTGGVGRRVGAAAMSDEQNLTPKKRLRWEKGFLVALRDTGNVRAACDAAKVSRTVVYAHRDEDEDFAQAWQDALEESADLLEQEARRRAYEGVQRLKFDRGKLITIPLLDTEGKVVLGSDGKPLTTPYVEHEYSDTLLIFLLKGIRPEVYRERTDVRHSGKIDVSKLSDDELQSITED